MIIIEFVIAAFICVGVPILIGDLMLPNEALGKQYIIGLFTTLAISQLLFLPFINCQHRFTPYYIIYVVIVGGLCIYALIRNYRGYKTKIRALFITNSFKDHFGIWLILALLIVGFQVGRAAFGHFFVYADNAHYIPVINDLIESDLDYYYDYKYALGGGREYDSKYLFTSYFPYLASICKASGLHPAVLVQTLLPVTLTISLYNLVWHYGFLLLGDKKYSWTFVFFFAVLIETISGYDFTFANHALSGIYFGKKIVFTILLPYILLFIAEKTSLLNNEVNLLKKVDVFRLFVMMLGICAPSLMGTGLAPISLFSIGIVLSIRKKSLRPMMQMIICMIPAIVMLFLVVRYMFFRA